MSAHNMFSDKPAPTVSEEMKTFIFLLVVGVALGAAYFAFDRTVLAIVGAFLVAYGVVRLVLAARTEKSTNRPK